MTRIDYVELALCIGIYIHLGHSTLYGNLKPNFATWFLWGVLDAITAVSIYLQHGNFFVVTIYTFASFIIAYCIWRSGNFSWSKFETFVAVMAIICMIIWALSGPRNATIAATAAMVIATIPAIIHAYEKPWENSLITWGGFLIVNTISTFQGKEWSVKERFYPAVCTGMCLILFALTM